jgi:hypothetical protein
MPRRYAPLLVALLAIIGLLGAAVACSSDEDTHKVTVTLKDNSITIEPNSAPKGPIEMAIKNEGSKKHSLLIIKTSTPEGELPTKDDGSVDTGGADVDVQHELDEIDDGDDTSRTYDMDPGSYVLISNEVQDENDVKTADYKNGMHASFTVTEGSGSASASATAAASGSRSPTPTATH